MNILFNIFNIIRNLSIRKGLKNINGNRVILPPKCLRFCSPDFKNDQYFLQSAKVDATCLVKGGKLDKSSAILDIGCGAGRIAIGLIQVLGPECRYVGIDVAQPQVEWCQRNISSRYPSYSFTRLDIRNDRYNPEGASRAIDLAIPLDDGSFDLICLFSVFSHMRNDDVASYLGEIARLLKPDGKVFFTAFIKKGPMMVINPAGYKSPSIGPLHRVQYDPEYLEGIWKEHGLVRVGEVLKRREQACLWLARDASSRYRRRS